MIPLTPQTEAELLARADAVAGLSLAQLARQMGVLLPKNLLQAKGWVGMLIERALGASSGSLPQPDFLQLGIELKTLPIHSNGKPRESTYVCSASLLTVGEEHTWHNSLVYRKLARVLWVPIEGDPKVPLAERRIGSAFLWSPSAAQASILQKDWQELTDMMSMGELDTITAHHGQYLQIRPKAANAKSLCLGINQEGEKVLTLPRGFYLRTCFTLQLLKMM